MTTAAPNTVVLTYRMGRWRTTPQNTGVTSAWSNLVNMLTFSDQRVVSSVRTPNFRRIKPRNLPMNPYTKDQTFLFDPLGSWLYDSRSYTNYQPSTHSINEYEANSQWITGVSLTQVDLVGNLVPAVTSKLLGKLNEGKTNTLVAAAELNKTASHLAKTASRIYSSVKALRKGDFGGFTTALGISYTEKQRKRFEKRYDKAKSFTAQEHRYSQASYNAEATRSRMSSFFSETWLEYSYGWKPLLKDVHDHAQALAELSIERQNIVRQVHAQMTVTKQTSSVTQSLIDPITISNSRKQTKGCKIVVHYKLQGNTLNAFNQLGINNPMEMAWELVPFSFVADWFLPVGNFLRDLTASTGLVFLNGYINHKNSHEQILAWSGGTPITNTSLGRRYSTIGGSGKGFRRDFELYRSTLTSFPIPSFPTFKDPRDSADYGVKKAISAITLLQSLFLKQKSTQSKYLD